MSQILVISIPILLLPILTRNLSIEHFADYSIYKAVMGLSTPIITFALSTYLLKKFYNELKNKIKIFIYNASFISLSIALALFTISFIFKKFVVGLLALDSFSTIFFAILNTLLFAIHTLFLTFYRARSKTVYFLFSNLIVFLVSISGVYSLAFFNLISLERVFIVQSVSYIFSLILHFTVFNQFYPRDFTFDKKLIKKSLIFSIPLVIYSIFTQIYGSFDKFLINDLLSKKELSIYAAVFQISFGITSLGKVLNLAWSPYLFKEMSNKKNISKDIYKNIIFLAILMALVSTIYFYLYPILINIFLPNEYYVSSSLYKWFVIAGYFQILYWIINPFLVIFDKRYYFLLSSIIAMIVNISLNLILLKNGIEYAAFVYSLTWIFQFSITLILIAYAKKNFKLEQKN